MLKLVALEEEEKGDASSVHMPETDLGEHTQEKVAKNPLHKSRNRPADPHG